MSTDMLSLRFGRRADAILLRTTPKVENAVYPFPPRIPSLNLIPTLITFLFVPD